ncbi:MAG TPA: VOC family protein [Solirubrobacteraceae bacterium]
MSERDGYEHGVPCAITAVHPDPDAAVAFYTRLFGWEAEDAMPAGSPGRHFVCTLNGREVAAVASARGEGPPVAGWQTHVWVDSADDAAARATDAGGRVVTEPFDLLDAGRTAVLTDPAGAVFGVWQPRRRRGAQVVNEAGAWAMSQLTTPDPEGAKAFYGSVFGWETDTFGVGEGEVTLWRVPGYLGGEPQQPVSRDVVGVMMSTGGDGVSPQWTVDFWVDDADGVADAITKLGGQVIVPPFDTPVSRTAVLADPQGVAFSATTVPGP